MSMFFDEGPGYVGGSFRKAVLHAVLNILLSRRCHGQRSFANSSNATFDIALDKCQHFNEHVEKINKDLVTFHPGNLFVMTVDIVCCNRVFERWELELELPKNSFDMNSSVLSAGSSSSKLSETSTVGAAHLNHADRKLRVMLRSLYSLCLTLPGNAVFSWLKKAGSPPRESIPRHNVYIKEKPPDVCENYDRKSFQIPTVNCKLGSFRVRVNYETDLYSIRKVMVSKAFVDDTEALFVDDSKGLGAFAIQEPTSFEQNFPYDDEEEGGDEEDVEEDAPVHIAATRVSSDPRAIPKRNSQQNRRNLQHTQSLPPLRYRFQPFKHSSSPSTPPLHRLANRLSRKGSSASRNSSQIDGDGLFAFADDELALSLTYCKAGHTHSLPARLVTLPSGTIYKSPSNNSLASLSGSLASSLHAGQHVETGTPSSSASSGAWVGGKVKRGQSLVGTPPSLIESVLEEETDLMFAYETVGVAPFSQAPKTSHNQKEQNAVRSRNHRVARMTAASAPLQMPWFIPESNNQAVLNRFIVQLASKDPNVTQVARSDPTNLETFMYILSKPVIELGGPERLKEPTMTLKDLKNELDTIYNAHISK